MVYECDECGTALPASLMTCPGCGEAFDERVPADAVLPEEIRTSLTPVPTLLPAAHVKPLPLSAAQSGPARAALENSASYAWMSPPTLLVNPSRNGFPGSILGAILQWTERRK